MLEVIIEIAGIQVLLFGLYYFSLRKESDYAWRRAFLLGMVAVSVCVPFIELPAPELVQSVNNSVMTSRDYILSPVSVPEDPIHSFEWSYVIQATSLIGSALFTLFLLFSFWQIFKLYRTGTPYSLGKLWIWLHPKVNSSFSFFNWIFSRDIHPTIIAHEAAHVNLKHSYDIVLLQLNRTLFWWNPVSWMILNEMTEVHEYQADRLALKDKSIDEYQELLINTTLSSMGWGLASSFHSGSLLKRLNAMKQKTKKISRWKISSLGALVAIIALVFACEELDKDIKKVSEDSRQISFEELPEDLQKIYFEGEEKFTFLIVYVEDHDVDNVREKLASLEAIDAELIEMIKVQYGENRNKEVLVVLRNDASSFDYIKETTKTDENTFKLVEVMPEFPGGMDGFYRYIGQNMTYPKQARKHGIEGQVFIQFVVDKTGQVIHPEILRGIGAGCDSAAFNAVANAPTFTPGTQDGEPVDVQMVIPINFKLHNANKAKEWTNQEKIDYLTQGVKHDPEKVKEMMNRDRRGESVDIDVEINENKYLKEVEIQDVGDAEAKRTAIAGAKLAEAATKLSEVTVVGLSANASGNGDVPPPPPPPMPAYKGGMDALYKFIASNLKYPKQAKNAGIEGRVYVQFVVKKDGTTGQVKVVKGIGAGCDAEAVRVVKLLDQWEPSTKNGQPMETQMTLPIKFAL